jgi:hypothetical protein
MLATCSFAYILPVVHTLSDVLEDVLCNICNCFEFLKRIHSLAVHLMFHMASERKYQMCEISRTRWITQFILLLFIDQEMHIQRVSENMSCSSK